MCMNMIDSHLLRVAYIYLICRCLYLYIRMIHCICYLQGTLVFLYYITNMFAVWLKEITSNLYEALLKKLFLTFTTMAEMDRESYSFFFIAVFFIKNTMIYIFKIIIKFFFLQESLYDSNWNKNGSGSYTLSFICIYMFFVYINISVTIFCKRNIQNAIKF